MKVLILGATGNVGQQALKVVDEMNHELVGFSYYSNIKLAKEISRKHNTNLSFSPIYPTENCKSFKQLIKQSKPQIIINAISGFDGLYGTIAAIKCGITLANANKESFVVAGKFINKLSKKYKVKIIPLDSEHAAIHELIQKFGSPEKIFITASGGPFYDYSNKELQNIQPDEAIKHPKWNMGKKISVDSATHINKCLEIIEAFWLFNTKEIFPIYHPEAMIHSMIQKNSKIYGIESMPSMINPIKYALSNLQANVQGTIFETKSFDGKYTLEHFSKNAVPIQWASEILKEDSQSKAIMLNAANEIAVDYFLHKKITFLEIYDVINFALKNLYFSNPKFLFQVINIHKKTRDFLNKNYFSKDK